jgi:hypothetical protein
VRLDLIALVGEVLLILGAQIDRGVSGLWSLSQRFFGEKRKSRKAAFEIGCQLI